MMTSDPTTTDAVTMLRRMHARAVECENRGEVPRIGSDEVLAVLRATEAECARHAEEVAALRAQSESAATSAPTNTPCLECSHEGDDPSLCEACGSPVIQLGVLGSRLYLRCTCCGMQTSIQNSRSEVARIPESEWTWYGHPLHFVGARTCLFRMGTKVGEYVVSTVGDWSVDGSSESRELDRGRKFETMVFRARGSHAECGCPDIEPEELECVGYNDAASAQAGHVEMCRKVAAGAFND